MRQLSGLNKCEISSATSGTEGDAVFEEVEVQSTLLAISITVVVRGFYDESTLMSTHYLHFVRISL